MKLEQRKPKMSKVMRVDLEDYNKSIVKVKIKTEKKLGLKLTDSKAFKILVNKRGFFNRWKR